MLAAQHVAGQVEQHLGVGAGPGRLPGAPGGQADDRANRRGDHHEYDQGEYLVRAGDNEGVVRLGEVVVEQQEPGDRGGDARPETSDDRGGHDHHHHRENVAGKRQLTAQAGQQHRRQRQPGRSDRKAGDPAARGQAAGRGEMAPPLAGLLMGHHMYVDRPGQRRGGYPDAAGQQLGEPAPARHPQDQLGGVDAAGEVQQRVRDVIADDLVVGAAEALRQGPAAGPDGPGRHRPGHGWG